MNTAVNKNSRDKKKYMVNIILLIIVLVLSFSPIFILRDAEFAGSDQKAEGIIMEINNEYKPWFHALWEPPSGEIESLLFALQAALGAGFIGYYFGYLQGKRKGGRQ